MPLSYPQPYIFSKSEYKLEHQQKGFGRAILMAGLLQLKELGADSVLLVTINTNIPAVTLYNKTGFKGVEINEYPSYEKQIAFSKQVE